MMLKDKKQPLGILVEIVSDGQKELSQINGENIWTRHTRDIRKKELGCVNNIGNSVVLMLSTIDAGVLLTLASFIPGRGDDCLSAWIYIPSSVQITGKELLEIVESTKKAVFNGKISNLESELNELFSKTYDVAPVNYAPLNNRSDKLAYRYYGKGSMYLLEDLLERRNQPYYNNYKGIFLLEKSSNLTCSLDDLTNELLTSDVVIEAPTPLDGFMPYVNGNPFMENQMAYEGDKFDVEWRKNGYKPIVTSTIIKKENNVLLSPTSNQYEVEIPYNHIRVKDRKGISLTDEDYRVYVNNRELTRTNKVYVSESKLQSVEIEVIPNDEDRYKKCKDIYDMSRHSEAKVMLEEQRFEYKFVFPQNKDTESVTGTFVFNKRLEKCPFKGFKLEESGSPTRHYENRCKPDWFSEEKLMIYAITAVIFLLVGLGIGWWISSSFVTNNEQPTNASPTIIPKITQPEEPVGERVDSLKLAKENLVREAIRYLENNEDWKKSDLEEFPITKGLYDALNRGKYEDVNKYANGELAKSKRFKELLDAIKNRKQGIKIRFRTNDIIPTKKYIKFHKEEALENDPKNNEQDNVNGQTPQQITGNKLYN